MIARKSSCPDVASVEQEKQESVEGCANQCRGEYGMFVYGTNEYGKKRCFTEDEVLMCNCYCFVDSLTYKCPDINAHAGYNLYVFKGREYLMNFEIITLDDIP